MNGNCRTNAVEGCYWSLSLYAMRNPTNLASSTILAIHQRNTAIPSLCPLLGSPDPVIGPGDRPKRPTDEMDRAPRAGALLFRLAQPRQLTNSANFSRQAYKVAALYHALSAVNSRERSQLSRPTRDMENLVAAVDYL
jgi:hypothetical protein